jgi:hypothetical protein
MREGRESRERVTDGERWNHVLERVREDLCPTYQESLHQSQDCEWLDQSYLTKTIAIEEPASCLGQIDDQINRWEGHYQAVEHC